MKSKRKIIQQKSSLFYFLFFFYSSHTYAEFHATLTAKTDYIWRGYSKTSENFALQANLDYEHVTGGYLGITVSNVDFDDDDFDDPSKVEMTPYLGWTFKLSDDWRFDAQWTRYFYDGDIFGHRPDYNEFYLLLHYNDIFTARASFSEDYYNQGHASGDYELTGRYPITDSFEFSTGIGYSQVQKILEYDILYWNVGLTYYTKFVAFDLRYLDSVEVTDEIETQWSYDPEIIDSYFVFSIFLGF
ncbi:MAG: TorF family putative porin [Methylococcaceae bacterium]|nr:TorF family putative porin [Methylococcaceae bacterium]